MFYKEIKQFRDLSNYYEILKKKKSIIFFDIQGVIILNNDFHEALNVKKYNNLLNQICKNRKENFLKISKFGRFYNSSLTDEKLPYYLSEMRSLNIELCLLTFARYSIDREKALKNHQVLKFFNQQIWAGGINKGILMIEYLKTRLEDNLSIEQVFFIDDKIEHLESAKTALENYKKNYFSNYFSYELFLYNKNPIKKVDEEEFIFYWNSVIDFYKKKFSSY